MLFSNTLLGRDANAAVADARKQLERQLTTSLREFARHGGWPGPVVESLSVKDSEGEGFRVNVSDSYLSAAMDLEYGTPDQPPTGLIRRFASQMDELVDGEPAIAELGRLL